MIKNVPLTPIPEDPSIQKKTLSTPEGKTSRFPFISSIVVASAMAITACSGPSPEEDDDSTQGCIFEPALESPLNLTVDCDPNHKPPKDNVCITYESRAVLAAQDTETVEENGGYPVQRACSIKNGREYVAGWEWFEPDTPIEEALAQLKNSTEPPAKLSIHCTFEPEYECLTSVDGGETWAPITEEREK